MKTNPVANRSIGGIQDLFEITGTVARNGHIPTK